MQNILGKMEILFILNPISGAVKKAGIPKMIDKYLDHTKFNYRIVYTEYAGHATEIASKASNDGVDIVVAVGGDGTINEIGKALVHTKTAMAIIPCGSGNGLARHLMIPVNVKKSIEIINRCHIKLLDYGMINDHPFFCTCGVGFDAFISMKFAKGKKRGKLRYVKLVLSEGLKYKGETYKVIDDNEKEEKEHFAYLISCANASQYGNNAYIAPQASMTDGLLDVIIMEPFGLLDAPQMSFDMMNKTLNKSCKVRTYTTRHIKVHRDQPGPVHFDGDPMEMGCDIDMSIVEKGINILVNPITDTKIIKPNVIQNAMCQLFNNITSLHNGVYKGGKKLWRKLKMK